VPIPRARKRRGRADVIWQKVIGYVSENPTEHGSEKQARCEDSTGVTGGVTGDYAKNFSTSNRIINFNAMLPLRASPTCL